MDNTGIAQLGISLHILRMEEGDQIYISKKHRWN